MPKVEADSNKRTVNPVNGRVNKPKLTNRGPAGLLTKKTGTMIPASSSVATGEESNKPLSGPQLWAQTEINKIAGSLTTLAVDIDSVSQDPVNARLHPERNMESIKDSLCLYGQTKPLVVRRDGMIISAGNGTHAAAKELGWTVIAVNIVEMTAVEAAGYGLADNRTAELAKWDFAVVARIDALLLEANHASVGWTTDELEVLRAADWQPPPIDDSADDGTSDRQQTDGLELTEDQSEIVYRAIDLVRADNPDKPAGDCLVDICNQFLEANNA